MKLQSLGMTKLIQYYLNFDIGPDNFVVKSGKVAIILFLTLPSIMTRGNSLMPSVPLFLVSVKLRKYIGGFGRLLLIHTCN